MEVRPSINCSDFACVSHYLLEAGKFLAAEDWVHFDIADARFTYNKTWNNPSEIARLFIAHPELKFQFEVHLMTEEPEAYMKEWVRAGVKRVIVHIEALVDPKYRGKPIDPKVAIASVFNEAAKGGAEVMLSSRPETNLENFKEYLEYFASFQVLSVMPGPSGQKFLPMAVEKIKFLRAQFPSAKIEVDGGINLETARLVKEVGADSVVAGNYIFGSSDFRGAYRELVKV